MAVLLVVSAGTAAADPFGWWATQPHPFAVNADTGVAGSDGTVTGNLLANDHGATAVVRHSALSDPSAGQLTVNADGSYSFVPAAGTHGTVSFTYTATDAVTLYKDAVPGADKIPPVAGTYPLEGANGSTVLISGGGYGSSFAPDPGKRGWFYGLTDRGPNADDDGPVGEKVFTDPTFSPQIGLFQLVGGKAVLHKTIVLKAPDGTLYNGLPVPITKIAASAEKAEDLYGNTIDPTQLYSVPGVSPPVTLNPDNGYDSEGLVAMPDGTFWVSDEYGPYITHFDKSGKEIERLSPWGADTGDGLGNGHNVDTAHPLPLELQLRTKNKGMEGLTITPDGSTLVGMMQSALSEPGVKAANVPVVRIVTINLKTKAMHEYLYLLTDPATTGSAVSEITALSDTKFLVDERDGNQGQPGEAAFKDLYEIDLTGATDVLKGTTYSFQNGSTTLLDTTKQQGLLINGQSIEAYVGSVPTAQAELKLAQAGIQPVNKTPYLEIGTLLNQIDPSGAFFSHDKIEGVATTDGGQTVYLSNDSDFGMDHLLGQDEAACEASGETDTTACTPVKSATTGRYLLHQKTLTASGMVDDGEVLEVNVSKLPLVLGTATVTIKY